MKEKDREDCRGGGSTLPRLGQSRYILIFLHPCGVWCYSLQDVLDGTPDGRSMTRLGITWKMQSSLLRKIRPEEPGKFFRLGSGIEIALIWVRGG